MLKRGEYIIIDVVKSKENAEAVEVEGLDTGLLQRRDFRYEKQQLRDLQIDPTTLPHKRTTFRHDPYSEIKHISTQLELFKKLKQSGAPAASALDSTREITGGSLVQRFLEINPDATYDEAIAHFNSIL